jgi:hypothetical protein
MTAVITEAQRFEMHTCLRGLMGEEVANTMMEHLPPSGWSDVVRKADLDHVEAALKTEVGHLKKSIDLINVHIEGIRSAQWTLVGITIICFIAQTAWIYNGIK